MKNGCLQRPSGEIGRHKFVSTGINNLEVIMPVCKKCSVKFKNKVFIDGKQRDLHRRSYCLNCSPFGTNKGQKFKVGVHNDKICDICERVFPWNKNNVCSSCRRKYLRYCQKRKAVDLLGNKCQFCGESDFWVLTFHHEDPSKKSLEMAAAFGTVSWKEIEREIKKCILLCIKCHMKHHMECEKILKIVSYYEPK